MTDEKPSKQEIDELIELIKPKKKHKKGWGHILKLVEDLKNKNNDNK